MVTPLRPQGFCWVLSQRMEHLAMTEVYYIVFHTLQHAVKSEVLGSKVGLQIEQVRSRQYLHIPGGSHKSKDLMIPCSSAIDIMGLRPIYEIPFWSD